MKSSRRRFHLLPALALLLSIAFLPAICQGPPDSGADNAGMGSGPGRLPGIRGTITAVSGSDYTVKTEEGATYEVQTGPNTRFTRQRQPLKASDIHVGDMIVAVGQVDDTAHSVGAAVFAVLDPEQVKRMKESFGKTWIAGTITAINMDELKITLKRPDGAAQTIAVDENTSFKKHRDSITMADIKVGDSIGGQGALANGVFLAKELRVGEPGQMRGFGSGAGGGPRTGRRPRGTGSGPESGPAPASSSDSKPDGSASAPAPSGSAADPAAGAPGSPRP